MKTLLIVTGAVCAILAAAWMRAVYVAGKYMDGVNNPRG